MLQRSGLGASGLGHDFQVQHVQDVEVKTAHRFPRIQGPGREVLRSRIPRQEISHTCGRREMAAHILTCPNEDRTGLLVETTEVLSTWLSQEHLIDLELAYWIHKYIMMRGNKPFASLGAMSPRMKALAISQDKIEWQNFMEGCISTHFYFIQHYHLALSGSYLNGSDWSKSLISKLLHITHSQWIDRNFTPHHSTTSSAGIHTRRTYRTSN
jgi:hypothetical protein